MKNVKELVAAFILLCFMSTIAVAAEEVKQSGVVELLAIVALLSVAIATILAFAVAVKMGGEMGTALKVIAVGLLFIDTLRELLGLLGEETYSEYAEIIGSIIILAGFYLLYKSTKA